MTRDDEDRAGQRASREEYDWDREDLVAWTRDPQLDPARECLLSWFEEDSTGVYYGRLIEVILEKNYFHWIAHKALKELSEEGAINTELAATAGNNRVRLYWSRRNRYPRRSAKALLKQIETHSAPDLTRALGHNAETLFGLAAGRNGFRLHGPEVRSYQGQQWTATDHDLDWVFERDGIGWGVEVKNEWAYIGREEMRSKVAMCKYLQLAPLFILRWAPKSYIEEIRLEGGFCLLYETQLFPLGLEDAMNRARALGLPAAVLRAVPGGTFERFVKWHEGRVARESGV